jgi:hypothetical protein
VFHLVALGEPIKILVRKKFSRSQLLACTANLPSSLIGLEACSGSHFLVAGPIAHDSPAWAKASMFSREVAVAAHG